MDQRSAAWFQSRAGKVTASRIADVMARTKTGYSTSRQNYLAQLVAERMTGQPQDSYTNAAMQWGIDTEPLARAAYEISHELFVTETGFHEHPNIIGSGASPDGMVDNSGLVEIKYPNTATHIEYILSRQIPQKYRLQMMWQMECTQREWCDFVSFDPRMPEKHQLLIIRVERDEALIDTIRNEVIHFLAEVQETVDRLLKLESYA